jgi:hypothetical protein
VLEFRVPLTTKKCRAMLRKTLIEMEKRDYQNTKKHNSVKQTKETKETTYTTYTTYTT